MTARLILLILIRGSLIATLLGCSKPGDGDIPEDSDTGNGTDPECDFFSITSSISPAISTVGIVEWAAQDISIINAYIEFGLDESYGKVAPVDLTEPNLRTLLLGMKPSWEYHFRIVVDDGNSVTTSCDSTLTTGPAPNGLPSVDVVTHDKAALYGGYTLSIFYSECETFITDEDGDYVWWYFPKMTKCSRARMSYDGKHMLIKNVNLLGVSDGTPNKGKITKVTMDGLEEESITLNSSHHDFTVLPDGTISFINYDGSNCDNVMEMDAKGKIKMVMRLADEITPPTDDEFPSGCHTNSIHYWPEDDSYTVSVLAKNLLMKISRTGDLIWILGGEENTFAGDDLTWLRQHGHHMYDGNILFFNNADVAESSKALVYSLDETNLEASLVWEYFAGNYNSITFGDAQHLPNSNTLVTFSNDGIIHEVDSDGNVLQETNWDLGGGLGYTMRRDSLYGPPPR